jgi:hypothetical protein
LNEHCVAAYQQVGDFEVTKVNGQVQKNGGNVVSYFLTPEGLVIDAVVGPVTADKLLSEAQWSQRLYKQMVTGGASKGVGWDKLALGERRPTIGLVVQAFRLPAGFGISRRSCESTS